MRKILFTAALAASALAVPAQADTLRFQGANTLQPGEILVNQFLGSGPNRTTLAGGSNAFTYFVDTDGDARLPTSLGMGNDGRTNGFGAVLSGGTYTYQLGFVAQVFSFLVGTVDTYNSVTFNFADNTARTFTGSQLMAPVTNGTAGGRLIYDVGGASGITSVTFASTQNSFEFDDFAAAAPEPATWAMMILGFGLAGASLRRRRSSGKLAVA